MDVNSLSEEEHDVESQEVDKEQALTNIFIEMHRAVDAREQEKVRRLLVCMEESGTADRLSFQCSWRLLRWAVTSGDAAMVRLLLAPRGPKPPVNRNSSHGRLLSPLWISILQGNFEIAELLLFAGANPNERLGPHLVHDWRSTPLHVLVSATTTASRAGGLARLIGVLIQHGADLDARDSSNQSVLHCAAMLGLVEVVHRLIMGGANVNAVNREGETVLHAVVRSGCGKQLLDILLAEGADPRARDHGGMNALHHLARANKEDLKTAEVLLKMGVSLDDICVDGSPLNLAVMGGKEKLIELFLDRGADINGKSRIGVFPLYLAVKYKKLSIIKLLLKRGAKLQEITTRGRTTLHCACGELQEANIRFLLEYGADVNAKDEDGNTAFSLIEYKNMNPPIKTMIKHFAKVNAINQEDLQIIRHYPKLNTFYNNCLDEIAKMKKEVLYNNFTFYCILSKSQTKLASLTRNLDFVIAFKTSERERLFPLYAFDLDYTFKNAEKRKDFLCSEERRLTSAFFGYLPNSVIRCILDYVSFEDL